MSNEVEFGIWLWQCCTDGKQKLGLSAAMIVMKLLEQAKRTLLEEMDELKLD